MKTTLELTYKELYLISCMASAYVDELNARIEFNKNCNLSYEWIIEELEKTNEFWAKIEKIKNEMIRGTK